MARSAHNLAQSGLIAVPRATNFSRAYVEVGGFSLSMHWQTFWRSVRHTLALDLHIATSDRARQGGRDSYMSYDDPWTREIMILALVSAFVSFGALAVLLAA
jgi:hypothetical protein